MTTNRIKNLCEMKFELKITDRTRKKEYVYARFVYYALCLLHLPKLTYIEIASSIGYDHASLIHGKKTFDDLYEQKYFSFYKEAFITLSNVIKNEMLVEQAEERSMPKDSKVLKQIILKTESESTLNNNVLLSILDLPFEARAEFMELAKNFYKEKAKELLTLY